METDACGRLIIQPKVTEESLIARGGYVGAIYHAPPDCVR